ncbi:hypothetical protein HDU98_002218 [Podochytrium sp. JEL0797]|nr:hypothetical protein HDU98_002218 [Podochytrium sp. JEL0797]
MSSPIPHPRTSIAPPKPLGSSSDPTVKSNSDRATSVSQSHVEMSADVKDNHDTFLTQRGGKIVQGTPLYVPLVSQNEKSSSIFDNRQTLQSTLLLQKKKEMNQVQSNLENKRAEFSKRMEECREKQEELRIKQKQIRERVTKFEKFLKENDAKRQRANMKAMSERKLREQKEQENQQLQHLQLDLQSETANILRLIKKYQIYENYLQSVVDTLPSDYLDMNEPHVNDIIMRHKTLVETNLDLIHMVTQSQDEIEERGGSLAALIKNKNDLILVYNSKLGTQQKYLDKLKQESAYKEQRIEERDKTGKERSRTIGETKLAINNLYDRIVSYNSGKPLLNTSSTIVITDAEDHILRATTGANGISQATGGGSGLTVGWAQPPAEDVLLREGNLEAASLAEKLKFIQEKNGPTAARKQIGQATENNNTTATNGRNVFPYGGKTPDINPAKSATAGIVVTSRVAARKMMFDKLISAGSGVLMQ